MPRHFDGRRLRDQRRLAGLSVADLATRVGRSPWSVWGYEAGRSQPPLTVADALAEVLALPLDRLLADDERQAA